METGNTLLTHTIRIGILMIGIGFAVFLGRYRPEWRSRKTLISWVWTIAVVDMIIMNDNFAQTISAQIIIGGALMLNIINFIGDRIETIKFKDFSASLKQEEGNESKHSLRTGKTKSKDKMSGWPDGDSQKGE